MTGSLISPDAPAVDMSPRRYELGRRRGSTEATRAKILEATRGLLGGKGDLVEFSMEAVASKAGVSRMTVYNQFHSQARLLEALADHLAEKGGMHRIAESFLEPRPDEAVRKFVATFVGLWASDRLLLRRVRAMGLVVPTVFRKVRDRDAWRREAARNLVRKLGVPKPGARSPDAEWAADLLTSMTSFEVFDALCDEARSPEALARSLSDTLVRLWGLGSEENGGRPARAAPPRSRRSRRRSAARSQRVGLRT
jgi:AcrR family transcriptional regulator